MMLYLEQAVDCLQQGQVLAYPTEAVWGLGCDPYNQSAFENILTLKQRPIEKGVILVAANMQQAEAFLTGLSVEQQHHIEQTWLHSTEQQQATTWLVPLTSAVPQWISGQHDKVAIRITHHPLVQQLCLAFGGAIVSTSANPAGLPPAISSAQVTHYFADIAILDGQLGHCKLPSKIIDIVTGDVIRA
jgi:L-threonylcarbamoyladenylate synthase